MRRELLVGSTRGPAEAAAEIARATIGAKSWPDSSHGAALLSSSYNVPSYGGFPIVREALMGALLATLSGVDHVLSWADLIEAARPTVSLATVARGAIEGLAKAHYLLSADGAESLVSRHIAITKADIKYPLRHSQFQDSTGQILDNEDIPTIHRVITSNLNLTLTEPKVQDMVRPLLSAGLRSGHDAGPEIYSQLSGPAHAAASALGMYLNAEDATFVLPPKIASEQAAYLFVAASGVAELWLDKFDADPIARDKWRSARAVAEQHLERLLLENP